MRSLAAEREARPTDADRRADPAAAEVQTHVGKRFKRLWKRKPITSILGPTVDPNGRLGPTVDPNGRTRTSVAMQPDLRSR
jgi:hypothetical protein